MRLLSSAVGPMTSSLNQHGGADHDHSTHLPTQSPTQSELGDPVQAVAHGQQRQEAEQAEPAWVHIKALEQALVLAEPERYVRIFIDDGVPMAALRSQEPGHRNTPSSTVVDLGRSWQAQIEAQEPLEQGRPPGKAQADSPYGHHARDRGQVQDPER